MRKQTTPLAAAAMSMAALVFATLAADGYAAPQASADDSHVALFKNVEGHVHVLRDNASLDAASGMTLYVSDHIVSDAGASAGIVFKDGTLITLGQFTDIKVRDYIFQPKEARYAFSMYLAKGSAIYSSGKIGKLSPESVKVDTPTSTVGVRGTRFIVEAD
jgi:FecR protein